MPVLAPLFLLGLGAVVVPLLVHLVQRERHEPTAFPSFMFLDRTPSPVSARRHLRNPWLLLLRVLALVALALAFARPVLGRRAAGAGVDPRRRDVVVLLDRSFSMRAGARWQAARAAVDSVIGTLTPADRMTLVPFDRLAIAVTPATGDAAVLRAALATLAPTDESTRLAAGVAVARQRLDAGDAPRKVLVVVSDFQRSGWDLTEDARLAPATEIVPVDVAGAAPVPDHAVRAVEVRMVRNQSRMEAVVGARLSNQGAAVSDIAVTLEVGGRVVQQRTVSLPRDGGTTVTFDAVPVTPEVVPARVRLAPDALPGDDAFHFLLQQEAVVPVLVVAQDPGPFLTRALSIGEMPRFDVTVRTPGRVSAADLAGRALVVLPDGAFPSGLGAVRLTAFVGNGGGLLVARGAAAEERSWPASARSLLPGAIGRVTDHSASGGAVLASLDARHPALALLAGPRAGDLAAARFQRVRAIDTTAGVLARFDDGTVALTEHAVGRGRVLTFASSLDGRWNDLPRQPAFLPLVQQLALHAAAWREAPRAMEIGASVRPADLAGAAGAGVARWSVTAPSGARTTIGGAGAAAVLQPREAGVFALRPGGSPGARPVLVAANIAPAELDFASFDGARLPAALAGAPAATSATRAEALQESPADREARQSGWWYLLAAAALLLVVEGLVARTVLTSSMADDIERGAVAPAPAGRSR
ncbi:MAG: VWA domain-containing protein [Gemmatimonadaceae bacterium]|nr:VWA domain-containing protein [Gemmatimonadaceae bacterium]